MNYKTISDINVTDLLKCYQELENKIAWEVVPKKFRQTGVQFAEGEDEFTSAIGSLKEGRKEEEYNRVNSLFKDTIFEEIIKKYKLVRSRLMWVEDRGCYSLHQDLSQRIHIPLVTNKDCMFIFLEDSDIFHLPAGHVYLVDTTKKHSFCNFSTQPRLHFVSCITDASLNA